ncbi:M16 family metallopeptidase [Pseudobacter ginsenosidimutans]|jgi:predicted Zn-dependent peptidase|uniref:Putative Zn-dependent peptidase n=1 Tax=Pseudobacter ginsenosidimutans TaxID=661488 RepID=A0A4V2F102_9BACT|nr:pitrilysin family protein [Pseudobacter ginsenosidimutans]QEC41305.1 insulinase family protein [Pseudobacter ginsenosidimutans]RZS71921.1 putative Zn-dependent peptidase [Pseudobacter ginsenosidimutans]
MIQFEKFTLPNGLRVIVHEDHTTPMAVVNIMYDVGARDEDPNKTGFAHLFEHLMFGGSINIEDYETPLQMAGGENNAYTSNDLTNYYVQLPAENVETAFWLESDRMLSLAFDEKSLEVQRKVVSEEFKEHYINKPYGDVWFKLREMAYKVHPYRWLTIGKELSHIENATLADVKAFFAEHYNPSNAIMVVGGNIKTAQVRELTEKWFGDIPSGKKWERHTPEEPVQTAPRREIVYADVPLDAIYKVYHMDNRLSHGYYVADLITEVMGGGGSSRLFQSLVKEKKLFSNIECYHFGTVDKGLLTIEGKLVKGVKMEDAEAAIEEELEKLKREGISEKELTKVKNKTESAIAFEDMSVMTRCNNLAFYELLGDASLFNSDREKYFSVTVEDVLNYSRKYFDVNNSCTLCYYSKQ